MIWKGKVLIQKRALVPISVSCPSGSLEDDETFEDAAVRELAEETQLTPAPAASNLVMFHKTQIPGVGGGLVDAAFYYVRLADDAVVQVRGPSAGHEGEVDTAETFGAVRGAKEIDGTGHAWIAPADLDAYVSGTAVRGENPLFADAVDKFMDILDQALGLPMENVNMNPSELPAWVPPSYFSLEDVPKECTGSFIGPDCLGKAVLRDIMAAEQFKNSLRLRKNPDSALRTYNQKAEELKTLQGLRTPSAEQATRRDELERELATGYADRLVHIRGADNEIHTFTVPNPYRALAYREDRRKPVNFAKPAEYEGGDNDPDGRMYAANTLLLNELAPAEMIADSAMATSLLESLWFCGSNPTLSTDPRCYPAKVLGELREWNANKKQSEIGRKAADALKDTSWSVTKQIMVALENAAAGGTVFPFIDMKAGAPAPAVAAPPTVTPPPSPAGGSPPASPPPSPTLPPAGIVPGGGPGPMVLPRAATATRPTPTPAPVTMKAGIITPFLPRPIMGAPLGGGAMFRPLIPVTLSV